MSVDQPSGETRDVAAVLTLERLEADLFRASAQSARVPRIFGGEVAGQAVLAAGLTGPEGRPVHSAHLHYLRPGDPARPVDYRVERVRDGGTFSTRQVEALQSGETILSAMVSLQAAETGLHHQVPGLTAASPHSLPPPGEQFAGDENFHGWLAFATSERALDIRFPEEPVRVATGRGERVAPVQRAWYRVPAALGDDPLRHAAALAYASDLMLLSVSLGPHGLRFGDPGLQFATLDHTIWFHAPARADHWFLYEQEGSWAGGGRALCRGHMLDEQGTLLATTIQEGLLRWRPPAEPSRA